MVNPYVIGMSKDGKPLALVLGYVLGVKDKGNVNMLLFKKDNTADLGLVKVRFEL